MTYFSIGINAKNSELHAAMGLCVLPKVPELIADRKKVFGYYDMTGSTLVELPAQVLLRASNTTTPIILLYSIRRKHCYVS
jgi:dTDP-4-amino-4,6-dideoxygalactose transaminase